MKLGINALALGAVFVSGAISGAIPGSLAGPIATVSKYAGDALHGPFNNTLASINLMLPQIKAAHKAAEYSVAALRDVYYKYRLTPGSMANVDSVSILWLSYNQYYREIIESVEDLLPLLTELEQLMFTNTEALLYYHMRKAH